MKYIPVLLSLVIFIKGIMVGVNGQIGVGLVMCVFSILAAAILLIPTDDHLNGRPY